MRLSTRRLARAAARPGVSGTARLDRRTRSIAKRVRPGDIAIIDHVDIDRRSAVALVEAKVGAVVNLAPSISGRYPNLGPKVLLDAGIPLLDDVGSEAFTDVSDGDTVRISGDTLFKGDQPVTSGRRHDPDSVAAALDSSRSGMVTQLEAFSANATEHLRREQALLLDGDGVPAVSTRLGGRHVVLVMRSFDYRNDLRALRAYIKANSPALIGVEAGADALLAAGYQPDLVVVDGDEISDRGLTCGAEVVARASSDGRIRGADRLDRLGVNHCVFPTNGTPEDAAMLLASSNQAALIVTVGSHSTLLELLDKGRSAMASAFLTRSTVGSQLVDAKAVAQLYQHRTRTWLALLMVVIGLAVVGAALATTPVGHQWWNDLLRSWAQAYAWVRSRIP